MRCFRLSCKWVCPLLLAILLCAFTQSLGANVGPSREAASSEELRKAILDRTVSVITITDNIMIDPVAWKDVINITRDCAITAKNPLLVLDFNGLNRTLFIAPGVTLAFKKISINQTSFWREGYQPVNFGNALKYSPGGIVLFKETNIYADVCAPIRQTKAALEGIAKSFPRVEGCPPGLQVVTFKRYCNLEKCYRNAWWHPDFCIQPPELQVDGAAMGQHFEIYDRTFLLCTVNMFSYPCPRQSVKEPVCPDPATISPPAAAVTKANTAATPTAAPQTKKSHSSSNVGVIVAAVIVPLVLLILAALLFVFRRKLPCCKGGVAGANAEDKDYMPVTQPLAKSPTSGTRTLDSSYSQYNTPSSQYRSSNPDSLKIRFSDTSSGAPGFPPNNFPVMDDSVELSTLLGRGSFGSVFRGRWRNKIVAVKILQHDTHQLQHIQNEAHLNTCLHHANVASALQIIHKRLGSTPKPPSDIQDLHDQSSSVDMEASGGVVDMMETWIIMDLCDQGSLESLSKKGAFDRDGKLFMHPLLLRLRDVAAGMTYMHGKNICHGDLKAGNVLVATSDVDPYRCTAKVADFGLSRVLVSAQSHLSTRTMGTPSRMPPELLLKGQLSAAGDVYAFGILLYEAATGQLPFKNMPIGELIHKVVMNHERPVMPPYVPKQYADLAIACWAPEREQRPTFKFVLQCVEAMLLNVEGLQREVDAFDYEGFAAAKAQADEKST